MNNYTVTIKNEKKTEAPLIHYTGIKSIEGIKAYIETMLETSETEIVLEEKELPPCKPANQAFYNYDKNPDLSQCEPCQEQGFHYTKR